MGESAKILCPDKRVYLPAPDARCPMADMATEEEILHMRGTVDDLAVVVYVNSSARLKAQADVVVTSANAVKVVSRLKEKNIYFIPDKNLGRSWRSSCPRSTFISDTAAVPFTTRRRSARRGGAFKASGALLLSHAECPEAVRALSAFVGSTAGMIAYAEKSAAQEFLIATEAGTLYDLRRRCPDKKFYTTREDFLCANMKKNTPEALRSVFAGGGIPVEVDENIAVRARRALRRMLELAQ